MHVNRICKGELTITRGYLQEISPRRRVLRPEAVRPNCPYEGCKRKLDEHVHCCDKKWEGEAVMVWSEHPFVVQRQQRSKEKP